MRGASEEKRNYKIPRLEYTTQIAKDQMCDSYVLLKEKTDGVKLQKPTSGLMTKERKIEEEIVCENIKYLLV